MRSRITALTLSGALALGLAASSGPPAAVSGAGSGSRSGSGSGADDHGAIAGAAELAEPALGLTTIDPSGAVDHLDLLDESVRAIAQIDPPTGLATDGRYLFAQTAEGIRVVDSGVWTWDHVDHFHYYRAEPRDLGTVRGTGEATVATSTQSSSGGTGVFFAGSGDDVLLDTEALSRGEIVEQFRMATTAHPGLVVPVGSFALVTQAESGSVVSLAGYTAEGEPTGVEEACPEAQGTITTRVGAVIGCRDGALLASVQAGALTIERIGYPEGTTAPPARDFANREGRPTVAALAGTEGVWLLDTRERSWTLLPAPEPLVAVTAVDDDDETVLALTADGRMLVLSGADGTVHARTEPLAAASVAAGQQPALIADQQRAYLSAPAEGMLYEIDFADDARIARTFESSAPLFTAGTGR